MSTNSSANSPSPRELHVELFADRKGWLTSLVINLALGIIMLIKFGTLGKVLGAWLVISAVRHGIRLVRAQGAKTVAIAITGDELQLPPHRFAQTPVAVPLASVRAAYFLRRYVPWRYSSPLLVVETGDGSASKAHVFPRDWFASEADQRRVISALAPHVKAA